MKDQLKLYVAIVATSARMLSSSPCSASPSTTHIPQKLSQTQRTSPQRLIPCTNSQHQMMLMIKHTFSSQDHHKCDPTIHQSKIKKIKIQQIVQDWISLICIKKFQIFKNSLYLSLVDLGADV